MYKNVLYTLVKSAGCMTSVQKSYTVYASSPTTSQQQLAVFDLNGTTYMVTDGTTAGVAPPSGINPGTMWAETIDRQRRDTVRPCLRVCLTTDERLPTRPGGIPVPGDRLQRQHHALRHRLYARQQRQRGEGRHSDTAPDVHAGGTRSRSRHHTRSPSRRVATTPSPRSSPRPPRRARASLESTRRRWSPPTLSSTN